jgi:V/A-type H+-transporting ATPase subunit D
MRTTGMRAATKAELVLIRRDLQVAREGVELLERKRDKLMAEGMKLLKQAAPLRLQLTREWERIQHDWKDTLEYQSYHRLKTFAGSVQQAPPLAGQEQRWMSVKLADFNYPKPRLEPLGSVIEIDIRPEQVRGATNKLIPELIQLMNLETSIRRIAAALKQCHRQVNALSQVITPELVSEKSRIEQRLEEKEREAIFQVKLLKARQL